MKKKLETDVLDLETGLDHANAANMETQKTIQKYGQQVREIQTKLEEESHAKSAAQECLVGAERKCNSNKNALEEARTLLEQSDRNRRCGVIIINKITKHLLPELWSRNCQTPMNNCPRPW